MAQQVDVAQALAAMGNAITGLTQAINQIIAGPPQQHNVLVSTTGAIIGAGVEKPAKFKGKKDGIQKNAEDARRFLLATAKEQTKGASIDERNARAGEKPEQVWGCNSN
jgi:hypothetical protein